MAFPILLQRGLFGVILSLHKDAVIKLLFDGAIDDTNKTKYFLNQITDRYKESVKGFNQAVAFNIGFATIALYAFLALPATGTVTIPFVSLPVSRIIWISLVPLISYGLQTLMITSFIWFQALRQGMKLLHKAVGLNQEFGDATNILLNGALGHMWIILRINKYFQSKVNYLWYVPALILFLTIMTSPLLLCVYFIFQLFIAKSIVLGIIYSVVFIPYSALFLSLISTASLLGLGDIAHQSTQSGQDTQSQNIPTTL
jgi:hypothetical protein